MCLICTHTGILICKTSRLNLSSTNMIRHGTELALKEKATSLLSPHTMDIISRANNQHRRQDISPVSSCQTFHKENTNLLVDHCIGRCASPYFMLVDQDLNAQEVVASHPFHRATRHSHVYPRETSETPQRKANRLFVKLY